VEPLNRCWYRSCHATIRTGVFTRREAAALRAAAHAVGWRRDAPEPDFPERGRIDYCELVMWPDTADR